MTLPSSERERINIAKRNTILSAEMHGFDPRFGFRPMQNLNAKLADGDGALLTCGPYEHLACGEGIQVLASTDPWLYI